MSPARVSASYAPGYHALTATGPLGVPAQQTTGIPARVSPRNRSNAAGGSVHITKGCRALGLRDDEGILWFWIGSHADYSRVLERR